MMLCVLCMLCLSRSDIAYRQQALLYADSQLGLGLMKDCAARRCMSASTNRNIGRGLVACLSLDSVHYTCFDRASPVSTCTRRRVCFLPLGLCPCLTQCYRHPLELLVRPSMETFLSLLAKDGRVEECWRAVRPPPSRVLQRSPRNKVQMFPLSPTMILHQLSILFIYLVDL